MFCKPFFFGYPSILGRGRRCSALVKGLRHNAAFARHLHGEKGLYLRLGRSLVRAVRLGREKTFRFLNSFPLRYFGRGCFCLNRLVNSGADCAEACRRAAQGAVFFWQTVNDGYFCAEACRRAAKRPIFFSLVLTPFRLSICQGAAVGGVAGVRCAAPVNAVAGEKIHKSV